MKLPTTSDFLTLMWVLFVTFMMFLCNKVEAHTKPNFETVVECINGYKFAVVFNSERDAKYVTIIDMEQVFDANGKGVMCGTSHKDHVQPEIVFPELETEEQIECLQ